ncbi:MAG: hypothetical protein J6N51_14205 [Selenomonas sp.]|nr:hypothetical protein [Selenomonas sp.]
MKISALFSATSMSRTSPPASSPGEVGKGAQMPFHVEQALQIAGGKMIVEGMYSSHVVRDRELITGQNPASDIARAKEFDIALQEKR